MKEQETFRWERMGVKVTSRDVLRYKSDKMGKSKGMEDFQGAAPYKGQ